jgi:hypothetical protein
MFETLDRRARLTGNRIKVLSAAIIGDALEFFDYFLIGFVLAFLIGPWKLTFGQPAIVLMSSGIGAMAGVVYYFIGIETRSKSIEQIDRELTAGRADRTTTASVRHA